MKKIEAYLQTFMLNKVEDALRAIHIHGMSVRFLRSNLRQDCLPARQASPLTLLVMTDPDESPIH